MTHRRATRCWGVALVVGLALPVAAIAGAQTIPELPAPSSSLPALPGALMFSKAPARPATPGAMREAPYAVRWAESIPGAGMRAFAIAGTILVTAGGPAPLQARSLETGESLWISETKSDGPLVIDDTTIVTSAGSSVIAIDLASGGTRWTVDLGAVSLGPTVRAGVVVAAAGSTVRALRIADGTEVWHTDVGVQVALAPVVSATRVALSLTDKSLAALELTTGDVMWRAPMDFAHTTLATSDDRVFVTTENNLLCSFRLPGTRPAWCFNVGIPAAGAPAIDARNVYVAYLDNVVRVFDVTGGAMRASPALPARPSGRARLAGPLLAIPLVTATAAFVGPSEQFAVYAMPSPDDALLPVLQGAAVSDDGEYVVLLTSSPSGWKLSALQKMKTPPAERPGPLVPVPVSAPPAAPQAPAPTPVAPASPSAPPAPAAGNPPAATK